LASYAPFLFRCRVAGSVLRAAFRRRVNGLPKAVPPIGPKLDFVLLWRNLLITGHERAYH